MAQHIKRMTSARTYHGVQKTSSGGRLQTYTITTAEGSMLTQSNRNHPHSGGPWSMQKFSRELAVPTFNTGNETSGYSGEVGPAATQTSFDDWFQNRPYDEDELRASGTTAIARTEPTQSEYSMATALGELMSSVPSAVGSSLLKERVRAARSAGSEYLNVEFGWKPLVADVRAFLNGVQNTDHIMRSYQEGSRRKIRQRLVFLPENRFHIEKTSINVLPNPRSWFSASGTCSLSETRETWFSGTYMYYVPPLESMNTLSRMALTARKVHGVELTPEVVWNLAPWSWAVDWFGNVGDVMHNVSAIGRDGLTLHHAYIMSRYKRVKSYQGTITGPGGAQRPTSMTESKVHQVRHAASPYGFNLGWDDFSPRQIAITTALGLSRQRAV